MQAMEISRTALDVEWRRLEIIAENLANANVAGSPNHPAFKELHLVSGPKNNFLSFLDPQAGTKPGIAIDSLAGVAVQAIVASDAPPHLVHEPGNPLANAQGFVGYPSIDHVAQMTAMVETARVYQANIVAMNAAREMYSKALQLGSGSQ